MGSSSTNLNLPVTMGEVRSPDILHSATNHPCHCINQSNLMVGDDVVVVVYVVVAAEVIKILTSVYLSCHGGTVGWHPNKVPHLEPFLLFPLSVKLDV